MTSDPADTDVLRRLDDAAAAVREHTRLAELVAEAAAARREHLLLPR